MLTTAMNLGYFLMVPLMHYWTQY